MNRAGLLGDVSSLLGMMGISIVTINGIDEGRRGLLIKSDNLEKLVDLKISLVKLMTSLLLNCVNQNYEIDWLYDMVDT